MTRFLPLALAAALALPVPAHAFLADNYLEVNPVNGDTFEVISRAGRGATDFWCAAGDYARSVLNVPGNQRIYLLQGRSQSITKPGRIGVQFTLVPPDFALDRNSRPLTLSLDNIGDSLRASFAMQYCYDRFEKRIFP